MAYWQEDGPGSDATDPDGSRRVRLVELKGLRIGVVVLTFAPLLINRSVCLVSSVHLTFVDRQAVAHIILLEPIKQILMNLKHLRIRQVVYRRTARKHHLCDALSISLLPRIRRRVKLESQS